MKSDNHINSNPSKLIKSFEGNKHTNGGLAESSLGDLVSEVGAHEYGARNLELLLDHLRYELDVRSVTLCETLKRNFHFSIHLDDCLGWKNLL